MPKISHLLAIFCSFIFLTPTMLFGSVPTHACSVLYEPDKSSFRFDWEEPTVDVFVGSVQRIELVDTQYEKVTFRVLQNLKGDVNSDRVEVFVRIPETNDMINSCGNYINIYEEGKTYIVTPQQTEDGRREIAVLDQTITSSSEVSQLSTVDIQFFEEQGTPIKPEILRSQATSSASDVSIDVDEYEFPGYRRDRIQINRMGDLGIVETVLISLISGFLLGALMAAGLVYLIMRKSNRV